MSRNVLGLDIGSYSIKAVEVRQTLRDLEVAQLREHVLLPGGTPLAEQLEELVRVHQLPTQHVVCALPGDRLSSRQIEFPFGDKRKVAAAVPFEVESQVPFDLEDIVIDWQTVTSDRSHTNLVATLAPRKEVALLLHTLREAHIDPRTVEAEGLVLASLAGFFDLPGRRLVLDIGHRKTTLCLLVDGNAMGSRSFPVAGAALTEAISKDRSISLEDAERMKAEDGVIQPDLEIASRGAASVLDRLSREVVRSLGSFEPLLGGPARDHLDGISLVGGTSRLHRLDEYLEQRSGVPVSKLALPTGPGATALVAGGDPSVFAPAAALALRGTTRTRSHMNFRQHELAYKVNFGKVARELRLTSVLAGLALLLFGGSVLAGQVIQGNRAEAVEQQIAEVYQQAFPGQQSPDPVAGLRGALVSAEDRAEVLGLYRGNLSALSLLAEVSARVPESIQIALEEVSIDGKVIRLRGYAPNVGTVDQLRAVLGKFEHFGPIPQPDVSRKKTGGYTFSLTITLAQGEER